MPNPRAFIVSCRGRCRQEEEDLAWAPRADEPLHGKYLTCRPLQMHRANARCDILLAVACTRSHDRDWLGTHERPMPRTARAPDKQQTSVSQYTHTKVYERSFFATDTGSRIQLQVFLQPILVPGFNYKSFPRLRKLQVIPTTAKS